MFESFAVPIVRPLLKFHSWRAVPLLANVLPDAMTEAAKELLVTLSTNNAMPSLVKVLLFAVKSLPPVT